MIWLLNFWLHLSSVGRVKKGVIHDLFLSFFICKINVKS